MTPIETQIKTTEFLSPIALRNANSLKKDRPNFGKHSFTLNEEDIAIYDQFMNNSMNRTNYIRKKNKVKAED